MIKTALLFIVMLATAGVCVHAAEPISKPDVSNIMTKAANWQLAAMKGTAPVDWVYGALYAGIMAQAETSRDAKYIDAMISVGEKNNWQLGSRPYHADDHCVGQTYLELYRLRKDSKMLKPTQAGMDELVRHLTSEEKLTWTWCDALFMAPATLAELSSVTGDKKYLDAMDKEWWKTTEALYDKNEHLFYRDDRFLNQRTKSGKLVFWSRGNGWVMGGLVRVLQYMPKDYPTRARYIEQFKDMAKKVASLQGKDGLWRPSLLDPDEIPVGETSGTGFFCYAIAWGINNGLLSATEYRPVVEKAWNGLVNAVGPDGKLGFVQPIGDRPNDVNADSTMPYGVGAFLLAGSEVYKLSSPGAPKPVSTASDDPIDRTIKQFCADIIGTSPNIGKALDIASKMTPEGSWSSIDYRSKQRASWSGGTHCDYIFTMTVALASGKAKPSEAAALESAIHRALAYWAEHDFQSPNWWHNEIGVPKTLGAVALLMGDKLQQSEFDYITGTCLPRGKIGMTGQNKVWLAGVTLMNALLKRDEAKAAQAADVISSEVTITTSEGVQPDFSFHQHGPQVQFGNYGGAFADDQLKWATVFYGTPWAMSPEKLDIMRRYVLDGLNWVNWRGQMDISSCGRQIYSNSPKGKSNGVTRFNERLVKLDEANKGKYEAFIKRNQPKAQNDLIGSRFFWRSDYLIDRRKDFCYTLKMCSKRVIGSESLNSENLSGYHLADGAMYIYRTGDEYENIFPVWNWRKLPGITCAQQDGPLPSFGNYRIDSDFVGGASDGVNACAVLDYNRDGVSAKKAWFFVGDQSICIGTGVTSDKTVAAPIATTINQCLLRGDVSVNDGKTTQTLAKGSREAVNPKWVEHDGFRYSFLMPEKVTISNQPQTGNWKKVFATTSTPKEDVTRDVFTVSIEHGVNPSNGSYAYSVSPTGKTAAKTEILVNSDKLQAVRVGKLAQAIFYAPGNLAYATGHVLTVSAPCVAIVDFSSKAPKLTVSDPTHKLISLTIKIDGKERTVTLPQEGEAGRSVPVNL